jgi:hypothetical protein
VLTPSNRCHLKKVGLEKKGAVLVFSRSVSKNLARGGYG